MVDESGFAQEIKGQYENALRLWVGMTKEVAGSAMRAVVNFKEGYPARCQLATQFGQILAAEQAIDKLTDVYVLYVVRVERRKSYEARAELAHIRERVGAAS